MKPGDRVRVELKCSIRGKEGTIVGQCTHPSGEKYGKVYKVQAVGVTGRDTWFCPNQLQIVREGPEDTRSREVEVLLPDNMTKEDLIEALRNWIPEKEN